MTAIEVAVAPGDLALTLAFVGPQVAVSVRGELDLVTAPDLTAILAAIVGRGHLHVVLDLSELAFIDASGLRAIVATSEDLEPVGGALVLRATSATTRRLLDIANVSELVTFERTVQGEAALGPEQRAGDHSRQVGSRSQTGMSDFARFAAIPANNEVVDAALRLVVALAKATVEGADGVSVSLHRHGSIETVAASDETIAQMDREQYATGEGPCLSAAAEGRWFHVESLDAEERWPDFIPRAMSDGIKSILSTPLIVNSKPVGALNMYSSSAGAFDTSQQELAALFATQASGVLTDAGIDVSAERSRQRLQDALDSREVIAQAQGVLMERVGVSPEDAHATIRRSSREAGTPMRQTAAELVDSTIRALPDGA